MSSRVKSYFFKHCHPPPSLNPKKKEEQLLTSFKGKIETKSTINLISNTHNYFKTNPFELLKNFPVTDPSSSPKINLNQQFP